VYSVVTCGAATLPQQEKGGSEDVSGAELVLPALSTQWQGNPRSDLPSASLSSWPRLLGGAGASFSRCYAAPAGGRRVAGEEQLGRCTAENRIYYRLYLHSSKLALAVMYLRRVRVAGRTLAAALAHVSTIVTDAPTKGT
jgi:hypothetical protein